LGATGRDPDGHEWDAGVRADVREEAGSAGLGLHDPFDPVAFGATSGPTHRHVPEHAIPRDDDRFDEAIFELVSTCLEGVRDAVGSIDRCAKRGQRGEQRLRRRHHAFARHRGVGALDPVQSRELQNCGSRRDSAGSLRRAGHHDRCSSSSSTPRTGVWIQSGRWSSS
jgi:hypothetical protein